MMDTGRNDGRRITSDDFGRSENTFLPMATFYDHDQAKDAEV